MSVDEKDLVADENTKYIVLLEQDTVTKMITASLMLTNGNTNGPPLVIGGVGLEITFNDKVAPYEYDPQNTADPHKYDKTRMYVDAGPTDSIAEFAKYCYTPLPTFNTVGSPTIQNNAEGRFIGAKISTVTEDGFITLAAGDTTTIAQAFFMPINGADPLNLDMFSFKWQIYLAKYIRHSTWFANGYSYVVANEDYPTSVVTYVHAPAAFKMHTQLPTPVVSADNTARAVNGYNPATMEWADSLEGIYRSDVLPIIGVNAQTVFIRAKGDANYSGDDEIYGDYKKYVASAAATVAFSVKSSAPVWVATDKKDAYGTKIPSNSHSYDAGADVIFYWDQKQKDEGVLVVGPKFFSSNKSLTIVVNSSSEYRKMTITAPGSYDVKKWVDAKGKTHNINMIWLRFND